MPIDMPAGFIVKMLRWLSQAITKALFLPTYRLSHEMWIKRHRLGSCWRSCSPELEYSTYFAQLTDLEPRISKIAFRSSSNDIANVSLVFEAQSPVSRFQENICITNVTKKAIVHSLINIPYQELLEIHPAYGPRFSWESFQIRNLKLTFADGRVVTPPDNLVSHLTHTWFMNSTWSRRWGQCWNLDAVQSAKQELSIYWRFVIGVRVVDGRSRNTGSSLLSNARRAITRSIASMMEKDWVVSVQFWLAIWLHLAVLTEDHRLRRKRPNQLADDSSQI